jgi:hypothetical protein
LVLLQASNEDFRDIEIENPQTHMIEVFPDTMLIASFTSEQLEWLEASKNAIENMANNAPFEDLAALLQEDFPENLKVCLTKLNDLADDFSIVDCLEDCLNSAQIERLNVFREALKLSLDIIASADLDQAKLWTREPGSLVNTDEWLRQRLHLDDNLQQQLDAITDPGSKSTLRQIRAMLHESSRFYKEIISRLNNLDNGAHLGNDIVEAVSKITEGLAEDEKSSWEDMQCALYGAVTWYMFCQARYAANQIRHLLRLSEA